MKQKQYPFTKRVYEYTEKRIELMKAYELLQGLNGVNCPVSHQAYAKAMKSLMAQYQDIREQVNAKWDREHKRAKKTGDYSRLVYLSHIQEINHKQGRAV